MKMRGTALVAMLVVVAGAGVCTGLPAGMGFDEDDFGPKDSPSYTVISEGETYEIRQYQAANWACSMRSGKMKSKREMMMMFINLMRYIGGENSLGEEIEMTAPVTMYKERSELVGVKKIEMCFYIPSEHQASPPTPTLDGVYIQSRDTMKVAVRSFMGMKKSMEDWEIEKLMLQKDLKKAGFTNLDFGNCFGAMYYAPKTEEHTNEVWYKME